jgi:hypothetical protein
VSDLNEAKNDQRAGDQPQERSAAPGVAGTAKNKERADHGSSCQVDGNAACETKATLHARLEQGRGRKADEKRAEKAWPERLICRRQAKQTRERSRGYGEGKATGELEASLDPKKLLAHARSDITDVAISSRCRGG